MAMRELIIFIFINFVFASAISLPLSLLLSRAYLCVNAQASVSHIYINTCVDVFVTRA